MITNKWLIAVALIQSVLNAVSASADDEVTILAVVDSITQGGNTFHSYREFLIPMLSMSGTKVRLVGPNQDNFSAHCGYSGKNTKFLNSIIGDVYAKFPANIVLMHSGHNSFSHDKPVAGIIKETEQIMETMHSLNPGVTILLAQVIPSGKLPKHNYIPELNKQLSKSADRMRAKGLHVVPVNQAEGFDWKSDTVEDRVHPNKSGANKMADQ